MKKQMRCLIVDDSPSFRAVLKSILAQVPGLEVVGEASDGERASALATQLRPDVITMDMNMPRRDGLAAIREIMTAAPTPIIVICAGAGGDPALGFKALELGAIEVLEKPEAKDPERFKRQADAIRLAVQAVAGLKLITRHPARTGGPFPGRGPGQLQCLGIVASTGGPQALRQLLSSLPGDFPTPILVVQHVVDGFTTALTKWLADHCAIGVGIATHGEPLRPGWALFAPDRCHLTAAGTTVRLDDGPPVKGFRPAGTVLLASLARAWGAGAGGLVLTGMGDDGVAGLRQIRDQGGFTAAQGPASSIIYGMPRIALESGAAEVSVELDDLAPMLLHLVGRPGGRRKVVLLVDADENTLQLEQLLLASSYAVHLARSWKEAQEKLRAIRPDAIVIGLSEAPEAPEWVGIPRVLVTREPETASRKARPGAWAVRRPYT